MGDDNEIPLDLQNDIKLAFDLYKNEKEKINKLKLRTLLFSFCMYKNSASDINEYIETETDPDKEEFDFDIVCLLVNQKLKSAKNKDADEIFNYMITNKNDKNDTENLKSEDNNLKTSAKQYLDNVSKNGTEYNLSNLQNIGKWVF